MKINNFDNQIAPPEVPVLIKLLIEWLYSISAQFTVLHGEITEQDFKQNVLNSQHCNTFLNVLMLWMNIWSDEVNIQTILNTYQNLFNLAGQVDNSKMKANIINTLGKFVTPKYYEKLSLKNILIIK